jgi:hypothetical protein
MAKRPLRADSALHNLTNQLSPVASLLLLLDGSRTLEALKEWETDFCTAAHLLTRFEKVDLACRAAMRHTEMVAKAIPYTRR